jgi:hypothetical protein
VTLLERPPWPTSDGIIPTATVAARLAAYGPQIDWAARICMAVGDEVALAAISPALSQIGHAAKEIRVAAIDEAIAGVRQTRNLEPGIKADLVHWFERWRPRAEQVDGERAAASARHAADQQRRADQEREFAEARARREAEYVAGLQAMAEEERRRRGLPAAAKEGAR